MQIAFEPAGHRPDDSAFSFVGRQEVIKRLGTLLKAGSRNVGILGLAGMGKTALVRQFITRNAGMFPGGVAQIPAWSLEHHMTTRFLTTCHVGRRQSLSMTQKRLNQGRLNLSGIS
jgi:ABC-type transport system involved in cytochrome bd biosynthesis fused ATPase/permease subunit